MDIGRIVMEIPWWSVVRTWCFHCPGPGSIPGQETKIPQAEWHCQKKKRGGRIVDDCSEFYHNKYIKIYKSMINKKKI